MSDSGLHRALRRQLRNLNLTPDHPPDTEQWQALLSRVNTSYLAAESDRYLLRRSVELVSQEMSGLNEALDRQARHDPLTGLPNRHGLHEVLAQLAESPTLRARSVAVLFIDLDGFKLVNDTLGHASGDALLTEVAGRISGSVREDDVVFRIGGDEFVVVCPSDGSRAQTGEIARRILAAIQRPVVIAGQDVTISASIGIANASAGDVTFDHVVSDADSAMYEAKHSGKAQVRFFDETIRQRLVSRLDTEQALRFAVANGELVLHYQPLLDLGNGRPVGFEALVRWDRPGRGLCLPETFLPVAEQAGLITDIDLWVLAEACRAAASWPDERLSVAVNMTALDLRNDATVTAVDAALCATGLSPHRVTIEINESTAASCDPVVEQNLAALRERGIVIALDDFGKGYSALAYLGQINAQVVKIDQSFVAGLGGGGSAEIIIKAIASMAHALGLTVLVEGVESQRQADYVSEIGCDLAQGFHFGRPISGADVDRMLAESLAGEPFAARHH